MSGLALRFLNRCGKRVQTMTAYKIIRMSSTDDPCSSKPPEPCSGRQEQKQEPCPPKPPEPCPPKPEACPSQPKATVCSEAPPCPPMPRCPPTICPPGRDRNNPCFYCPPACVDPDEPDITRLKKFQCLFQRDDGLPVYLKRGKLDAFMYQGAVVLMLLSLTISLYYLLGFLIKYHSS